MERNGRAGRRRVSNWSAGNSSAVAASMMIRMRRLSDRFAKIHDERSPR